MAIISQFPGPGSLLGHQATNQTSALMSIHQALPILMLISFDGFRPDYVDPDIAPTLFELASRGSLANMESLYVTKTFPNHFSMATGLYEDEHEIVNNNMFDPKLNKTFKPGIKLPDWWDPKGRTIPIWTALELYGHRLNGGLKRYSGCMMYPGSMTPFAGRQCTYVKDFNTKRNWTENVDAVIEWITNPELPASFVAMYFEDPDRVAHSYGPWGQETLEAVRGIDNATAYLITRLESLNLLNRTNLLFVSDHGMDQVKSIAYFDEIMDISMIDIVGASPSWSIFVKPQFRKQKDKIFQQLKEASNSANFIVYERSQINPKHHYSRSSRIGDFFIMVDEQHDIFISRSKKFKALPHPWGNHGWDPHLNAMRPLFLGVGPSFKENYAHLESFPNIDLFPLMASLLKLPLELLPNNGTLDNVIDMIKQD